MIYEGSLGVVIVLDTGIDLASATSVRIRYKKPNGVRGSWVGDVYESTKIKYTTISGDLNVSGNWRIQAYAVLPTWTGFGTICTFPVSKPLES